jgi:signal transduction histidine kinase
MTPMTRIETVDARMLALVRCVLAFSAFAVIWIAPSEPQRLVPLTYASLAIYAVYSAIIALISRRSDPAASHRALHWIDVFFYAYLVGLTEGTSSIFYHFFYFSILVAAFSRGFREGVYVTAASFVLFSTVGVASAPRGGEFELDRTLIRAVYLFVFGYLISYWGGYESLLKGRLRLLREINNLGNPRFGVDHAIGGNLDRLRDFYAANLCLLVLRRPAASPAFVMYSALPQSPGHSRSPRAIGEDAAAPLLQLPEKAAAFYHDPDGPWRTKYRGHAVHELEPHVRGKTYSDACRALANLLDTHAFITASYAQRDGTAGRIYVASDTGGFTHSDIEFLAQVSATLSTVVENMQLMEDLISRATEHERSRISRDLHDTAIQPYIGLKLALEALQREAGTDGPLGQRLSGLVAMADMTIRDLRDYATTLKEETALPGDFLIAAVKKQADRLGRFYGLEIEVKSDISAPLKGRIAAEAFQIISEGLSNVMRHTTARNAFVVILCENSSLLLQIGNEAGAGGPGTRNFTPRSIHERTQALGGTMFVERRPDGYTVVHVTIPM